MVLQRQTKSWREAAEAELARLRIEQKTQPGRTWIDWLPPEYKTSRVKWPTEALEKAVSSETTPTLEVWGPEEISAFVDQYVRQRREEEPEASSPPLKKQKKLSAEAQDAFDDLWKMDFGVEWANPFRTRLSKEACAQLGMADYYAKVPQPMDLSLIRTKLRSDAYADDDSLRNDVALIPHNARLYHPADSPLITFADQLLHAFDTRILRTFNLRSNLQSSFTSTSTSSLSTKNSSFATKF